MGENSVDQSWIMDKFDKTISVKWCKMLRYIYISIVLIVVVLIINILPPPPSAMAGAPTCPSGIDSDSINEWLFGVVPVRHFSTKYSGSTQVSPKQICNVEHWVIGRVKDGDEGVVDYQGRYSIFPSDKKTPFISDDVVSGVPWQINLKDGRILYPIEPIFWINSKNDRKFYVLSEPKTKPTNVPEDAVWVGGLDKKEVYVRYVYDNNNSYKVWLYEFFRGKVPKNGQEMARIISGPLNYILSPESHENYMGISPIFIDQYNRFILFDGRILQPKR